MTHLVLTAATAVLCLAQISPLSRHLAGQAQSAAVTYLHPSLHGNRAGCAPYRYDRYDPEYLAAPPNSAYRCGEWVHIQGPAGQVTAQRRDTCPGCGPTHYDLSEAGFLAVCGPLSRGRCTVTVSPAATHPGEDE